VAEVVVGIGRNPLATNVPDVLLAAAADLGVACREVDLASLVLRVGTEGAVELSDAGGPVRVTHLAPTLLYWQEAAAVALEAAETAGCRALNPVAASLVADDKARTAVALAAAGIPQLRTVVVPQSGTACRDAADALGWPVVVKRTHGAQGRWVRQARDAVELDAVVADFAQEGRGALVVQELCAEAAGRSLRMICTGGRVVAATERVAAAGELQSNISRGGSQGAVDLTAAEAHLAVAATAALGLGHAGVDLLRTDRGSVVLEVNACPDFTSMLPFVEADIARAVVEAVLAAPQPQQ
jgi:ribosomal protein S6--L-glutamate ligase